MLLEPGRLIYRGPFSTAPAHAHSAWQMLLVTNGGTVTLSTPHGGAPAREVTAAVIPAGAPHVTESYGAHGVMVWLDAHSTAARALDARIASTAPTPNSRLDVTTWAAAAEAYSGAPGDPMRHLPPRTTREDVVAALAPLLAAVCDLPYEAGRPRHPALAEALARLPRTVHDPVTLRSLAEDVGISAGRLGRLFTAELGLSFTHCRRWERLRRAMREVRAGASLTDAASAAGFTDSAHLTRVTREMFGLSPSKLAAAIEWL
ncbi:AraC family transcriptional regulator [Streptomyces sp. ODS28]|uniref:helix-turn-helix transcriptional regulator n=1 Tax=Streptomyces sp. ODS28 TaxID=3136688 RepID=UPI0031ED3A2C